MKSERPQGPVLFSELCKQTLLASWAWFRSSVTYQQRRAGEDHKEKEEERVQRERELHSCIHRLKGSGRVIQKGKFFLMSEATSLGNISQNTFLFEYPHIATSTSECM